MINEENDVGMEQIITETCENIWNNQEYNKDYYDKKVVKEKRINEGDLAYIEGREKKDQRNKLYGIFKGPYLVDILDDGK